MKGRVEFLFYVATGAGMALACSSFMMLAGLFEVTTPLWVVLAIALSASFCAVVAASIGELASMFPSAPAIRTYFKAAFGVRSSLAVIYLYLVFVVLIAGVEANIFALVTKAIAPGVPGLVAVLAPLAAVTVLNLLGLELPRFAQMVLTFGAMALIVAGASLGIGAAPGDVVSSLDPGGAGDALTSLPSALAIAVFLFVGFEWLSAVGLRPKSYERKIPLAMPVAVASLAVTYGLFAIALAGTLPRAEVADTLMPQLPYFEEVIGAAGLYAAGVLSLSAIFSTFNAGMMGASRLLLAISREDCLPPWCGSVLTRTSAPLGSVLLLSGLVGTASVTVWALDAQLLVSIVAAAMICVVYAGYVHSAVRLRRMAPDHPRPYRTPVPVRVQQGVVAAFLVISAATLVSLPEYGLRAAAGMAIAAAVACALALWSARRAARIAALRPPPRPRQRRARTGAAAASNGAGAAPAPAPAPAATEAPVVASGATTEAGRS